MFTAGVFESQTTHTFAFLPCLAAAPKEQQLSACTTQVHCLLTTLGKAIQSVTTLTLRVVHLASCIGSARPSLEQVSGRFYLEHEDCGYEVHWSKNRSACPEPLGDLPDSVFAMLAAAVPHVATLCLSGRVRGAALQAFGAACPALESLNVAAPHVMMQALHGVDTHLPRLTGVTLTCHREDCVMTNQRQLGCWTEDVLQELQQCGRLSKLDISFARSYPNLDCRKEAWTLLPYGLEHLRIDSPLFEVSDLDQIAVRMMPRLSLASPPCKTRLKVFQKFPVLHELEVLWSKDDQPSQAGLLVQCSENAHISKRSLIKERFLVQNFCLKSEWLDFWGSGVEVQNMFAWLPKQLTVTNVTIKFDGSEHINCLQQLPYLFPNLVTFELQGALSWSASWAMDLHFFEPLAACVHFRSLLITCPGLGLTTAGLVQLCAGLVQLTNLQYVACEGVNWQLLRLYLGQHVTFTEL